MVRIMNREVLDRWCERGIIGLVLAILVFGPLAAGAVRTLELLVIEGLTMVVMALWGLRFWLNCRAISQKEARREHPSGYAEVDELLKSHGAEA